MPKTVAFSHLSRPAQAFLGLLIVLSFVGLFFVFEASAVESFKLFGHQYYFFRQQTIWLVIAFFALLINFFIPLKYYYHFAFIWYGIGIALLILPLIPGVGLNLNGASRWIQLPFGTFQPVEFFKLVFINFYAAFLSKKPKIAPFVFYMIFPIILLLLQPDFGSLIVVVATGFVLYFLAHGSMKELLIISAAGILLALLVILLSPYRRERLLTYVGVAADKSDESYHIHQITLALGNGALLGRGIGNSQQKYAYVPEASSDSIFAIIAEELGFVGSLMLLALFASYFILANVMYKRTQQKQDRYRYLLFYGLLGWVAIQVILNLSAVVALVPLTGIPLPFFSQGGSALLMLFVANGLLLQICNRFPLTK